MIIDLTITIDLVNNESDVIKCLLDNGIMNTVYIITKGIQRLLI